MRKLLFFIFAFFLVLRVHGQCPGPAQRTALLNLQKAGIIESSRAGQIPLTDACGNQRYAQYTEVDLVPISYTPASTGNTQNYSEFVTTLSGDVWYIDWQGRAIKVWNNSGGGGGANDYDWLNIADNTIPDNIADSIYTGKYASVNMRRVWPNAQMLVGDSTGTNGASGIVAGDRSARWGFVRMLDDSWSSIGQEGTTNAIRLGPGTTAFKVSVAAGASPSEAIAPFRDVASFRTDSLIRFNDYPNTRNDTATAVNFFYSDSQGYLKSGPVSEIAGGGVSLPLNQVGFGSGSGITSDTTVKIMPSLTGPYSTFGPYIQKNQKWINPISPVTLTIDNRFRPSGNAIIPQMVIKSPSRSTENWDFVIAQQARNNWIDQAGQLTDTTFNEVVLWGFNPANVLGSASINKPALWYAMEPNWYNGGQKWAEFHQSINWGDGEKRLFTTEVQSIKNPSARIATTQFLADRFSVGRLASGNGNAYWTLSSAPSKTVENVFSCGAEQWRITADSITNSFVFLANGLNKNSSLMFFKGAQQTSMSDYLNRTIFHSITRATFNEFNFGRTDYPTSTTFYSSGAESGFGTRFSTPTLSTINYANRGQVFVTGGAYQMTFGQRSDVNTSYIASTGTIDLVAQKIGINKDAPRTTFDINATDAMTVPSGTTAQRPTTPTAGDIRHNSTTNEYEGAISGSFYSFARVVKSTANLDFPAMTGPLPETVVMTVPGAVVGDACIVEPTTTWAGTALLKPACYVSGVNQVTVQVTNMSGVSIDLPSQDFKCTVIKY